MRQVPARLEAIVLAAGSGSRFGGGKLTAPWRAGVLLDGALSAAFAAPVRSVTVVTGADPGVAPAARGFAGARGELCRLRVVEAQDHAEGMGASLRAGVAAMPGDAEGAFVFLGDMPRIPVDVLPLLAGALRDGAAVAPSYLGQRGHPVLFGAALFGPLLALCGDAGARGVLAALGGALITVPTESDGVLFDVDRREQIEGAAEKR